MSKRFPATTIVRFIDDDLRSIHRLLYVNYVIKCIQLRIKVVTVEIKEELYVFRPCVKIDYSITVKIKSLGIRQVKMITIVATSTEDSEIHLYSVRRARQTLL